MCPAPQPISDRNMTSLSLGGGGNCRPSALRSDNFERWLSPETCEFLMKNKSRVTFEMLLGHWSENGRLTFEPEHSAKHVPTSTSTILFNSSLGYSLSFLRAHALFEAGDQLGAAAFVLNGGFLKQCLRTSLEDMQRIFVEQFQRRESAAFYKVLANYGLARAAVAFPASMKQFFQMVVPSSQWLLRQYVQQTTSPGQKHLNAISESWSSNRPALPPSSRPDTADLTASLIFSNHQDGSHHELNVSVDRLLKDILHQYAAHHQLSIKHLRFFTSHGKPIFVSDAGKHSLRDLGWTTGATVRVHHHQQQPSLHPTGGTQQHSKEATIKSKSSSNNSNNNKKSKKNKKNNKRNKNTPSSRLPTTVAMNNLQQSRVDHSLLLSKVFAEADNQFKLIRKRLNEQSIQCQKPKVRKSRTSSILASTSPSFNHTLAHNENTKAGTSRYLIRVGEVEHLYKSSKPRSKRGSGTSSRNNSAIATSIDLHGCTQQEALSALDDCLPQWLETANAGNRAPWIVLVEIIVGGGNQIVSEAVRGWIKNNEKVARAPTSYVA